MSAIQCHRDFIWTTLERHEMFLLDKFAENYVRADPRIHMMTFNVIKEGDAKKIEVSRVHHPCAHTIAIPPVLTGEAGGPGRHRQVCRLRGEAD